MNNPLSVRQLQILELAREGMTNEWIADRLGWSKPMVEMEFRRMFNLLNSNNRTHTVIKAIRRGYIDLEGYRYVNE